MDLSFARVAERDNKMVIYLDEEQRKYRHVSNFVVSLLCEVEAGCKSGYLCEVIYSGESLG